MFGSRGAGNFLTKLTTGSAIVFMFTSLSLAYFSSHDSEVALFDKKALEAEQAAERESKSALTEEGESLELEEVGGLEEIDPAPTEQGGAAAP